MMIMKNILVILWIFLLFGNMAHATTSNDIFNIYYQWNPNRQDIYIVPPGKDLVINFIYADSVTSAELFFRDNGLEIRWAWFVDNKNTVNLVVKDLLQLKDSSSTNNFVITWILVDEGEDISALLKWDDPGMNKKVFDEATLLEIYEYEALSMIFILLYTFYMRVIGAKRKKRPFGFLFKKYWL